METSITKHPICGNDKCCSSTGIHGGLTHGWGYLDFNGFWQFECPESNNLHRKQDNILYLNLGQLEFIDLREGDNYE